MTEKDVPILIGRDEADLLVSAIEKMKLWATPCQIKYIRRKRVLTVLNKKIKNG